MSALAHEGKVIKGKLYDDIEKLIKADIKDLQAEKLYIYQIGNEVSGFSPIYSFVGPVENEEHYPNFAILGELSNSTKGLAILSQLVGRVLFI